MKDSYSFDIDDEGLQASYDKHRNAYVKIFDRLGFDYVIEARQCAMAARPGRSSSMAENGEDTFVRSPGGYAANVEAVVVPQAEPVDYTDVPAAEVVDTPDTPTIETLVDSLNAKHPRPDGRDWHAADSLKNVLVTLVHPDGRREPLAIGVPGDRAVDEKRLAAPGGGRGGAVRRRGLRSIRRWRRATSARACWGRRTPPGSATCSTRGSVSARHGPPARTGPGST